MAITSTQQGVYSLLKYAFQFHLKEYSHLYYWQKPPKVNLDYHPDCPLHQMHIVLWNYVTRLQCWS